MTAAGIKTPRSLTTGNREDAVAILREYFHRSDEATGRKYFTGALFDGFDPSGTRCESADEFTSDDLVSVRLLSVEVGGRASVDLLVRERDKFSKLLVEVGSDREFADEPSVAKDQFGPAWDLWRALTALPGVGPTTASKLMARKRPRLFPVYDSVINSYLLNGSGIYWQPLHKLLGTDEPPLVTRLSEAKRDAGIPRGVSLLRVFDVLAWMEGKGYAASVTGWVD